MTFEANKASCDLKFQDALIFMVLVNVENNYLPKLAYLLPMEYICSNQHG